MCEAYLLSKCPCFGIEQQNELLPVCRSVICWAIVQMPSAGGFLVQHVEWFQRLSRHSQFVYHSAGMCFGRSNRKLHGFIVPFIMLLSAHTARHFVGHVRSVQGPNGSVGATTSRLQTGDAGMVDEQVLGLSDNWGRSLTTQLRSTGCMQPFGTRLKGDRSGIILSMKPSTKNCMKDSLLGNGIDWPIVAIYEYL